MVLKSPLQKALLISALVFSGWGVFSYFHPSFEARARLDLTREVARIDTEPFSGPVYHGCPDPFPIQTEAEKVLFQILTERSPTSPRSSIHRQQAFSLRHFRAERIPDTAYSFLLTFASNDPEFSIRLASEYCHHKLRS